MPGSIVPLPVMLEEEDRKIYDRIEPPKSMVVRYGYQKLVAELPYDGDAKPGCGSKLVIRTQRGTELATMLTSTCPNAGCGNAVTRKQMLEYIENSGGKDYPFTEQGKVVRVATIDDMNDQSHFDNEKPDIIKFTREQIRELDLDMHLVEVEPLLGGERLIFHYTAEEWVDFRELVKRLAGRFRTRIEMHQVNAREEARIVADYERCGQQCCCKQFLKVLKPVSMRAAKVQKATLDPTKISGRCGRLMCCLRYEDETYESLRKRLPHRKTRVMTEDGEGIVVDSQILTQLVLVKLDPSNKVAAYPLENLEILERPNQKKKKPNKDDRDTRDDSGSGGGKPRGGQPSGKSDQKSGGYGGKPRDDQRGQGEDRRDVEQAGNEPRRPQPGKPLRDDEVESREGQPTAPDMNNASDPRDGDDQTHDGPVDATDHGGEKTPIDEGGQGETSSSDGQSGDESHGRGKRRRKRRRGRRRKRKGGGGGGDGGGS